ncbi:MAG: hypothetical protein K5650_04495 [Bacteroidales bacterium]|nr:hypothetical protein [Bacteroidales bacterium]
MKRLMLIVTAVLALVAACQPESNCRVPFGTGGSIDLSMPKWYDLRTMGNPVTINRGHKGIYVTRLGDDLFVAFECACPNDNDECMLPDTEANFGNDTATHYGEMVLRCPVCNATYNALDGQPIDNASCPLHQYTATLDGNILTIN